MEESELPINSIGIKFEILAIYYVHGSNLIDLVLHRLETTGDVSKPQKSEVIKLRSEFLYELTVCILPGYEFTSS